MIALLIAASLFAADPIRTLIVTGGHDHHPAFYSLFDSPELKPNVNPHPNAFASDMRGKYDVVVLHHALCSYVDWRWWSEEVVGARYRFEPETPLSTFKHDEDIPAQVVKPHPITAGLKDFTINDETYKRMWFSPKIDVLLRTSNPTSDGPVAWLGLHSKARVAVIQLGHGDIAFRDANYRRLVLNAIRWAAGSH